MVELLSRAQLRLDRAVTTATGIHAQGAACRFRISWAQMLASVRVNPSGHRLVHLDLLCQVTAGTRCLHHHRTIGEHPTNHVKELQRGVPKLTTDSRTLCHDLHRHMRSRRIDQPSMVWPGFCSRRNNSHRHLKRSRLVRSVSQQVMTLAVVCRVRDQSSTTPICRVPKCTRTGHR
jgi:hypothetical protein